MSETSRTGGSRLTVFHTHLRIGGVERVLVNLIRELHKRGHEIDVLLVEDTGEFRSKLPDGVRTVELDWSTGPFVGIFSAIVPLIRHIRAQRPDTLLSAKPHTNVVSLLAREFSGVSTRSVVSRHSMTSHQLERLDSTRHRLTVELSKHLYPRADDVVTVSEGVKADVADVLGLSERRISVIYNPIVTPRLREQSERPVDHPWFDDEGPPVVMGLGRLHPQKNYSSLITAFATLRKREDARLVILGDGETRPELEHHAAELGVEDEVELPGSTENPYRYMRQASAVAVSSVTEALPSALIEAMAVGCPVVSTNCSSGPVEILQDGEYGPLVPVDDPDALADALVSILHNPPDSEKLRARANDFSGSAVADEYEQILFGD